MRAMNLQGWIKPLPNGRSTSPKAVFQLFRSMQSLNHKSIAEFQKFKRGTAEKKHQTRMTLKILSKTCHLSTTEGSLELRGKYQLLLFSENRCARKLKKS